MPLLNHDALFDVYEALQLDKSSHTCLVGICLWYSQSMTEEDRHFS